MGALRTLAPWPPGVWSGWHHRAAAAAVDAGMPTGKVIPGPIVCVFGPQPGGVAPARVDRPAVGALPLE